MNLYKIKSKIQTYQKIKTNFPLFDGLYLFSLVWLTIGITLSFTLNHFFFKYHGNQFVAPDTLNLFIMLIYGYLCCFLFDNLRTHIDLVNDFALIFITLSLIALATNACQLTPYSNIDNFLGHHDIISQLNAMKWLKAHPLLSLVLKWVYNSLNSMIAFCCVSFLLLRFRRITHDFCRYMLFTVAIGYTLYYFLPSCGPASILPSDFFLLEQHANHIKFHEIHQGLAPSTNDGGLIAFPSFHVLWAWGCVRCFYPFKRFFLILFAWFVGICLSCFFLGWHYALDIISSLFIIFITEKLLRGKSAFIHKVETMAA